MVTTNRCDDAQPVTSTGVGVIGLTGAAGVAPVPNTSLGARTNGATTVDALTTGGNPVAVPVAVAVFLTIPFATSAAVVVYVPVHVMDAPTASGSDGGQTMPEAGINGSVIVTVASGCAPVFVTTKVNVITVPGALNELTLADFTNVMAGNPGTFKSSDALTGVSSGPVPVTVPVLLREPATTFACVVV
jgi:hypothetical protein